MYVCMYVCMHVYISHPASTNAKTSPFGVCRYVCVGDTVICENIHVYTHTKSPLKPDICWMHIP